MSEVTLMEELQGIANCCECEATEKRLNGWIKKASAAPEQEPAKYEFQGRDGNWCPFEDDRHYQNTLEDGTWPIRALYTHADDGELERLRAELADTQAKLATAHHNMGVGFDAESTLEQKLAEAQAIMERVEKHYMLGMSIYGECEDIRAFLSATAQPAEVKS